MRESHFRLNRGEVVAALLTVLSLAGVLAAMNYLAGDAGASDRGPRAAIPAARGAPEAADPPVLTPEQEFAAHVQFEAATLLEWLRFVAGEDVCGDPCIREPSAARNLAQLVSRCERLGPASLRAAPAYRPALNDAVTALEGACDTLLSARERLGPPADTARWLRAADEASTYLAGIPGIDSRAPLP